MSKSPGHQKLTAISLASSLGLFFYVAVALFLLSPFSSLLSPANAQSSDAIAIRVIPNPKHYSPSRWYAEQKFSGSPQEMTVDGYDAIRDGNVVYVDAANIKRGALPADDKFYTNIYVISFNLGAEMATSDIFGQILQFWKFNTNIPTPGVCHTGIYATTTTTCLNNNDCANGQFCDSHKGSVVRDTRRLADLAELNIRLANYRAANGNICPIVAQGSYVPNHSLSTWPSWQGTLGRLLGGLIPTDPINLLGTCKPNNVADNAKYEPQTCWDLERKIFAMPVAPAPPYSMALPTSSKAYAYVTDKDGRKCAFSTTLETAYANLIDAACVAGSSQTCASAGIATTPTNPLTVDCANILAPPGSAVSAYINIRPATRTTIRNVTIATQPNNGWPNNYPLSITQSPTANIWQVKAASSTTATGIYSFTLRITDSAASTSIKNCSIKISKSTTSLIPITAKRVMQGHVLPNIDIRALAKGLSQVPIKFNINITKVGDAAKTSLNTTFFKNIDIPTGNINGIVSPLNNLEYDSGFGSDEVVADPGQNPALGQDYLVEVKAIDMAGNTPTMSFKINVYNPLPTIETLNADIRLKASTTININQKIAELKDDPEHFNLSTTSLARTDNLGGAIIPRGLGDSGSGNSGLKPNQIYQYFFTGNLANTNIFSLLSNVLEYTLRISDKFGIYRELRFNLTVANQRPVLDTSRCNQAQTVNWGAPINCILTATDPDSNLIKSISVANDGLPLDTQLPNPKPATFTHNFSFNSTEPNSRPSIHNVIFRTVDEFGLESEPYAVQWTINNRCGDGFKQSPNSAGLAEGCDDGNNANRDGCSSLCSVEPNFNCNNANPSVCVGNTRTTDCAPKPANTAWNGLSTFSQTWNGIAWNPANVATIHDPIAGACHYECSAGLTWNALTSSCNTNKCGLVGTIKTCVDDSATTYFNDQLLYVNHGWNVIDSAQLHALPIKNVIAIQANNVLGIYGYAMSIDFGNGCYVKNTNSIDGWKCTTVAPVGFWTSIFYDDSSWPNAVITRDGPGLRNGNWLQDTNMIWANLGGNNQTIWCRYSFIVD